MFVMLPGGLHMTGQTDVRSAIPMPMVYEDVPLIPAQWEYRVLTIDTREEAPLTVERLNEMGSEGWLLIGVLNLPDGSVPEDSRQRRRPEAPIHYYFVRQKMV
jgi:hypothetical protein